MSTLVLVVEDHPDIRDAIRFALEDEGYRVLTAANGHEALDRITNDLPAVVLLDLAMPVMSGWEFHAHIRARGLNVPVVFMTTGEWASMEAERCGAEGCLPKPFNIDELYGTVTRFAGERAG